MPLLHQYRELEAHLWTVESSQPCLNLNRPLRTVPWGCILKEKWAKKDPLGPVQGNHTSQLHIIWDMKRENTKKILTLNRQYLGDAVTSNVFTIRSSVNRAHSWTVGMSRIQKLHAYCTTSSFTCLVCTYGCSYWFDVLLWFLVVFLSHSVALTFWAFRCLSQFELQLLSWTTIAWWEGSSFLLCVDQWWQRPSKVTGCCLSCQGDNGLFEISADLAKGKFTSW